MSTQTERYSTRRAHDGGHHVFDTLTGKNVTTGIGSVTKRAAQREALALNLMRAQSGRHCLAATAHGVYCNTEMDAYVDVCPNADQHK